MGHYSEQVRLDGDEWPAIELESGANARIEGGEERKTAPASCKSVPPSDLDAQLLAAPDCDDSDTSEPFEEFPERITLDDFLRRCDDERCEHRNLPGDCVKCFDRDYERRMTRCER